MSIRKVRKDSNCSRGRRLPLGLLLCLFSFVAPAQQRDTGIISDKMAEEVMKDMQSGGIPGLSLVVIRGNQWELRCFGYADRARKKPVSAGTLFELGSCSKAFTALAVMKLVEAGAIDLNADVSRYLPWFRATYGDSTVHLTIAQLLHHTSGIPWQTISKIPEGNDAGALERTIRGISGLSLDHLPGTAYEYATINYDILALVIQEVTNRPFEEYLVQNVFEPLGLRHTLIGRPTDADSIATGYKIGFFEPRAYTAPVYRSNNAAGYVITDATDMVEWLRVQLGISGSREDSLARLTHQRDETVPLHNMSAYAMGWNVSLNGDGELYHDGLNPNFTSYITLQPQKSLGVAVLANSNSGYTSVIGNRLMELLDGREETKVFNPDDRNDRIFSIISLITGIYVLLVTAFLFSIVRDIVKKKRKYAGGALSKAGAFFRSLLPALPYLAGIYLLPKVIAGADWKTTLVWSPISFEVLIIILISAFIMSYLTYLAGLFFPDENKFKRIIPRVLLISVLSGISNMIVIALVTSALGSSIDWKYLVYYYLLALTLYLLGRRFVQISLIKFTSNLIYELRLNLIDKVFSTSYQRFERMDRGRVYTAMIDDVNTIGDSANMAVMLITSIFTALGAFFYLGFIAFWVTVLTILLIVTISTVYFIATKSTNGYFEAARDTQNVFMRLVNGMIDGYKEISLHYRKKLEYKADIARTADRYREKTSTANIKFVNAFLVGESSLVVLLGLVVFALPRLFPDIQTYVIMNFVILLLYLIGPINSILNSIPAIMRVRIAWKRIQQFLKDIPVSIDLEKIAVHTDSCIQSIRAEGIAFHYEHDGNQDPFGVGPIDLEIKGGEIVFVIGGNGSGKTTLAKLLTGLYTPDEGNIFINNEPVNGHELSEYFSAVFNPVCLFEKLYTIDVQEKSGIIAKFLKTLELDKKVHVSGEGYSTISLSGGQRKRLALLQCYLEDRPIYLFDEWAADQDPAYRRFFYQVLLPEMKSAGKTVIAITHDDHYFDVADKVYKMEEGRLEPIYHLNYTL